MDKPIKNPSDEDLLQKMRESVKDSSEHPFIISDNFIKLVKIFAMFPKIVISNSTHAAEAMNAIVSLIVTFVKNIPDSVWEIFQKVANSPGNDNRPHWQLFKHIEAIRDFQGEKVVECDFQGEKVVEWEGKIDDEDDTPSINTKAPNARA